MTAVVQAVLLVAAPAGAYLLARHVAPARWMGPVVVCYLAGIAAANIPGIPVDEAVSTQFVELAVPLSIPLLLFCTDLPRWLKLARPVLISFALACSASMLSALLFGTHLGAGERDLSVVSGMLVGSFTGGTPNLNAIGLALNVQREVFVLVNAADVVTGGAYLLFLLTLAGPLVRRFLPHTPAAPWGDDADGNASGRVFVKDVAIALGLSVTVVAASVGASWVLFGALLPIPVMLAVSTFALALSFVPRVRALRGSFEAGEYVMLVFCAGIGTLVDFGKLATSNPMILGLVTAILVGAVLIHLCLARLFKIDADTALITSAATIFGPPFIAPVARALGNRELVVSGITVGLAGFAVGTYLGLFAAWLLGV